MDRKAAKLVEFKLTTEGDNQGEFLATFAKLSVVDRDKDVTIPGAFTNGQEVRVCQWGHNWSALPAGKGTISADDEFARCNGAFFLDTSHGMDTYRTVKNLGSLQEWSYGYDVKDYSFGEWEGEQVRFLRKLDVFEVSPVLLGAGIDTGTDLIKSFSYGDEGDRLLEAIEAYILRSGDLKSLRAKDGRVLSDRNRRRLIALRDRLGEMASLRDELETLLEETAPKTDDEPKSDADDTNSSLRGVWNRERMRSQRHITEAARHILVGA